MDRRAKIEAAIAAQEQLRSVVGDDVVEAAITALRSQLDDESTPPPQRKLVTVLFADLAGFTEWGESADIEDLGETLHSLWQRLDATVVSYGGRIDKHIGDALMAVWGVDQASDADPERAVRAALEMRAAFGEVWPEQSGSDVRIRIGVNTGPAILRSVGSTGEYTALGDAVNVASRLEQAAPTGEVLISHDTYRHVRGVFTVTEQPRLKVKGKQEPLRSYVVSALRPRAFRMETRGIQGLETRTVGRQSELETLREQLTDVISSRTGALVTVAGEAGVGKSRLLYEFLDWLQLQPTDVFLFRARAEAHRESVPYGLFRDLLLSRFEIPLDESGSSVRDGLVAGFADLAGLEPADALAAAHLVGIDVSGREQMPSDPEQLRELGEAAVRRLVSSTAQRDPVVVIVEDLHWADQLSLALLESIATSTDGPVLVAASARPALFEALPEWGSGSHRLDLEPLTMEASRSQVEDLLRAADEVPAGLVEAIVAAAAGNPFYVEEFVNSLIESGAIEVDEDRWVVDPAAAAELATTPPTLAALLQARLDRLDPAGRALLQAAAVVGQTFWDDALASLLGPSRGSDGLPNLLARDLITSMPTSSFTGTAEYVFKHALLRDVTYGSVLRSDRDRFHIAAARWIEERTDESSWAAVIAYHYDSAHAPQAARWFVRAGSHARRLYANEQALAAYERALELGGLENADLFEAYDGAGDVLLLLARYEEAVGKHRAMVEAAKAVGEIAAQGRGMTGVLFAASRIGGLAELSSLAAETVATVRSMPTPDHRLLCEALRGAGWVAMRAGDLPAALRYADEAAAAARAGGDRRGLSLSLNLLGLTESALGDHRAADNHLKEAVAIDRELGNRHEEGTSLLNLGESARLRGAYEQAAHHYEQALGVAREVGDADSGALALSNLGGAFVGLGRFGEAVASLTESIEAFSAAGRREYLGEAKQFLAEANLGLGDVDSAVRFAIEALHEGTEAGSRLQIGHAWRTLGRAAATHGSVVVDGEPVTADGCFERSVSELAGSEIDRAVALADWARSKSAGDPATARQLWERALGILEPLGLANLAGEPPAGW